MIRLIILCSGCELNKIILQRICDVKYTNSVTSVFCTPENENQSWQVLGEAFQF
jgi:hypothetical protein